VVVALIVGAGGGSGRNFKANLSGAEEVPPSRPTRRAKHRSMQTKPRPRSASVRRSRTVTTSFAWPVPTSIAHCAPAGANGPVVAFLAAPVPGGFHGNVDVGAAVAELVDAMAAGDTYVDVHSPAFPGGEVRGQIG